MDVDFQLCNEECIPHSINDYAPTLVNKLERAHELARDQLQLTASRMKDKNLNTLNFNVGDEVYVLNLRLYQGRCPKQVRRYSDIALITEKINDVTYKVHCEKWTIKEKLVHVDKLKMRLCSNPQNHLASGGWEKMQSSSVNSTDMRLLFTACGKHESLLSF